MDGWRKTGMDRREGGRESVVVCEGEMVIVPEKGQLGGE